MSGYNNQDLQNARASGKILRDTFKMLEAHVVAGVSTIELDKIAHDYIIKRGGIPSFLNYQGYKHSICTSINEQSIHGMPREDRFLCDGDIISIDIGVRYPATGGMCTDAARTFAVGDISDEARELIRVTEECFDVAIRGLCAGSYVREIGERIQKFIDGRYGIVETYMGHGVGRAVHEGELIPNFATAIKGDPKFTQGDIIAIEPMINIGSKDVKVSKDGWTVVTADGSLAAHYENTLIVHKDRVEVVT